MEAHIRDIAEHEGKEIEITGWLYNIRSSGKIHFLQLRDGTGRIQGVAVKGEIDDAFFKVASELKMESSLRAAGVVREDKRSPSGYELTLTRIEPIDIPEEDFPIAKQSHGEDFLLSNRHLWLRSHDQFHILRIRSEAEWAIRQFFQDRKFILLDSPILTGAIGESAGTLFETEYFDLGKAYLAQTGQLYLEAGAAAFRNVYCFGPTFRAEKSKTRRHLTEFWMIEAEMAFCSSSESMDLQEEMVKYLIRHVLEHCGNDFRELKRDTSLLEGIAGSEPFVRVSYSEAVEYLKEQGSEIAWGNDLGGRDETMVSEKYDTPVFVYNYPAEAKAFYMEDAPEGDGTVLCSDLLAPEGYGEIIGGSERMSDYDSLREKIREAGLPEEAYQWYLDIRKYGTFQHAGFGLGLERTVSWLCGIPHVREAIPFPRMMKRLYP